MVLKKFNQPRCLSVCISGHMTPEQLQKFHYGASKHSMVGQHPLTASGGSRSDITPANTETVSVLSTNITSMHFERVGILANCLLKQEVLLWRWTGAMNIPVT